MISHVTVNVIVNRFLLGNKFVWSHPGVTGQLTRFMLRLRLRQLGTHFFSDLAPGDAGAGDAEPCFLWTQREKPDTEKWEEEVWLFVLVVTREHLIINSRLLWPLLVESLMWSLSSLGQPRPAQTLWLLPSCINNVVIILMGGHTNLHAFHYH